MSAKVESLRRKIERIKQELLGLGDLRPGKLTQQYNVCGNAGCRCKANPPQRHGPYDQLSWTRKRKSTTRFIRKGHLAAVQSQVRTYQRLQELVDRWIELSIELCDIELKMDNAQQATSKRHKRGEKQANSG